MTEPNQPMVKIYGTRGSAACYSIRDFLHRSDVPFQWIDLTSGEEAGAEAGVRGPDDPSLPVWRRVVSVHILCLDDCLSTTIMPQPTEITQFIFGRPLRCFQ